MSAPSQNYVLVEKPDSKRPVDGNQSVADRSDNRDLIDLVLRRLGRPDSATALPRVPTRLSTGLAGGGVGASGQSADRAPVGPGNTPEPSPLLKLGDNSTSNPSIPDGAPSTDDTKAVPRVDVPIPLLSLAKRLVMGRGGRGKGAMHPVSVTTVARYAGTGTSGTFYAPVLTLLPNSSSAVTEASQFAALFDEGKCMGVKVHARILGVNSNGAWAFTYDPANSAAYTSVTGVLVAAQHLGPMAFNASSTTSAATFVVNNTGYQTKQFRCLRVLPTAGGGSASENVGSDWFATSDQNACAGYIKFAVDAVTSDTFMYDVFVQFHMMYRSRT